MAFLSEGGVQQADGADERHLAGRSAARNSSALLEREMKLHGPERYALTFDSRQFKIRAPDGGDRFRGRACGREPKLYVFSVNGSPIYVGVTKQPVRTRLRLGWNAKGETGYHGYAFRRELRRADLDVWYLEGNSGATPEVDAETIEAEIVFLIRSKGQWPKFQTEIHFHPSEPRHRELAGNILAHY